MRALVYLQSVWLRANNSATIEVAGKILLACMRALASYQVAARTHAPRVTTLGMRTPLDHFSDRVDH